MAATLLRASTLLALGANARRAPAQIRRIQEKKLCALVRHAYERVPFYRRLFDQHRLTPDAVQGLDDLPLLPLVSKADLLAQPPSDVLAQRVRPERCRVSCSSGTTGFPITVYALPSDQIAMNCGWIRAYMANGMRPRDRLAAFVGRGGDRRRMRWFERAGVFPRVEISAWLEPREWVRILRHWRPQIITGYVMTLRILAEHLRAEGIDDIRPRLVFHTSALLDDGSRRLFEETFRCRVVDIYGSDEAGCIAWECPRCDGYHVNGDQLIVEVMEGDHPAPPGGSGEVVITNLNSRAMPFIRYRQEDVAQRSPHAPRCGRPFPLLARIDGRTEDFLVLKSGARMPPHPFYHCIDPVPGVLRWRIVQEAAGSIVVEIQANGALTSEPLGRIRRDLEALTRGQMDVELALMDEIRVDAGAKFRTITSRAGRMET